MSVIIGQGGGGVFMSNTNAVTSSTDLGSTGIGGSNENFASIGPLTINSGVTVTVNSGANLRIL